MLSVAAPPLTAESSKTDVAAKTFFSESPKALPETFEEDS
jgi:hypothetical protein